MSRRPVVMAGAVVLCSAFLTATSAAAGTHTPANAAHAPAAARIATTLSGWGTAREVPGSKTLNQGGHATINSVSCAAPGDCVAAGAYASSALNRVPVLEAMVASSTGRIWGTAEEVPGTATLNAGNSAVVESVSCDAVGDCGAGGYYTDANRHFQAFVVSESGGTWGTAEKVPGTASLNVGSPGAVVDSVSCHGTGDCSAGGYYTDGSGDRQAFVVNETNGTWGTAEEVPGTATLNAGGDAQINSMSCAAAGECSAGGTYASGAVDGIPAAQAFVVNETGGTWGTAEEVPGTAALNGGGYAVVNSVSCSAVGDCAAGGQYTSSSPATQAFVVEETSGTWGTAEEVPGIAALNTRLLAQVTAVSCASPGNCSAVGSYQDASFDNQAFADTETNGTWGTGKEIPGFAALDAASPGGTAASVSCGAVGDCGVGGYYTDANGLRQAFVVNEAGGTWGSAEEVPGTAALNGGGYAQITSVSCTAIGSCSGGGSYSSKTRNGVPNGQAFVVNEVNGP